MARIRSIKPSFFRSDDVVAISHAARLTWIGLWIYGDDDGRSIDDARLIKVDVWPLEDAISVEDVESHLVELERLGRIRRYVVDGKRYLEVVNFSKHQVIKNRSRTGHPAPPWAVANPALTQSSPPANPALKTEGEGEVEVDMEREGEASGDAEPPQFCPKHPTSSGGTPCGPCGDARTIHQAWSRSQKALPTPRPPRKSIEKHCDVPGHSEYIIDRAGTCAKCDREGTADAPSAFERQGQVA